MVIILRQWKKLAGLDGLWSDFFSKDDFANDDTSKKQNYKGDLDKSTVALKGTMKRKRMAVEYSPIPVVFFNSRFTVDSTKGRGKVGQKKKRRNDLLLALKNKKYHLLQKNRTATFLANNQNEKIISLCQKQNFLIVEYQKDELGIDSRKRKNVKSAKNLSTSITPNKNKGANLSIASSFLNEGNFLLSHLSPLGLDHLDDKILKFETAYVRQKKEHSSQKNYQIAINGLDFDTTFQDVFSSNQDGGREKKHAEKIQQKSDLNPSQMSENGIFTKRHQKNSKDVIRPMFADILKYFNMKLLVLYDEKMEQSSEQMRIFFIKFFSLMDTNSVYVEGGARLHAMMRRLGLFNKLLIYRSNKLLGDGVSAFQSYGDDEKETFTEKGRVKDSSVLVMPTFSQVNDELKSCYLSLENGHQSKAVRSFLDEENLI